MYRITDSDALQSIGTANFETILYLLSFGNFVILFNGENIQKSRYVKDLHNAVVHTGKLHTAFRVH